MPGTASSPEPQGRSRLVNPIETAPTAALPISVSMTLRERFMMRPLARFKADRRAALIQNLACQLPPEKACANEPKPPRVTPPEPASDDPPDEE